MEPPSVWFAHSWHFAMRRRRMTQAEVAGFFGTDPSHEYYGTWTPEMEREEEFQDEVYLFELEFNAGRPRPWEVADVD